MSKDELLKKYEPQRQECQVFTRVMGYLRPSASFNAGKKSEFNERVFFTEGICKCHMK